MRDRPGNSVRFLRVVGISLISVFACCRFLRVNGISGTSLFTRWHGNSTNFHERIWSPSVMLL